MVSCMVSGYAAAILRFSQLTSALRRVFPFPWESTLAGLIAPPTHLRAQTFPCWECAGVAYYPSPPLESSWSSPANYLVAASCVTTIAPPSKRLYRQVITQTVEYHTLAATWWPNSRIPPETHDRRGWRQTFASISNTSVPRNEHHPVLGWSSDPSPCMFR